MGSFGLPALQTRTPEQPDLLGQLGKLQQLKNMGQQGQIQQQTIQENQLQLQLKQQQMKDQQVVMQVAQKYQNGLADPQALQELSGKISAATYVPLQKSIVDTQKSYAELDEKNLANQGQRDQKFLGMIQQLKSAPPDQYPALFAQAIPQAEALEPKLKGKLNPNQPIAQQALDGLTIGFATSAQIASQEAEKRAQAEEQRKAAMAPLELREKAAGADLKEQEAKMGGTSPEMIGMKDWLQKNPGKGPSDFLSWKAKQSPMGVVLGNQLGAAGQGSALDQSAQRYLQTGELPAGFARSPGTTSAIIKRAAELDPNANIAGNKATYKADSAALSKLNTQAEMVGAFESTAVKNLDRLAQTAKAIPDLGAKFANVPIRMITAKMIGTEAMSRLQADLLTARSESARVLNSANANGVLTNEARQEAEDVLNGNLPYKSMVAAIDELKNDMNNRKVSYADDIASIQKRLGQKSGTEDKSANGPMKITLPSGKQITIE